MIKNLLMGTLNFNDMNNKLTIGILVGIIIKLGLILYFKPINDVQPYNGKTDTVYINKPYKVPNKLSDISIPEIIYKYFKDTVSIKEVIYKDTNIVKFITEYKDTIIYSNDFLINFPEASKLLSLEVGNSKLKLGLYHPEEGLSEIQHNYNPKYLYHYNYVDGLTYNKNNFWSNFYSIVNYSIKPLINHHEVNYSIYYENSKIIYIGGISLYYSHNLPKPFGITPEIGLGYKF